MKEKKKLLPLLIVNVILLLMVLIPTIMIGITGISLFGQLVGSSRWIASISFVVDQISFIILGSLSFYLGRVMLRNEEKYDRKFAIAYHVIGIILILLLIALIPSIMVMKETMGISFSGQLAVLFIWINFISSFVRDIIFTILGSLSFYLGRVMLRNEEKYDRKFAIAYHVIGIILILTGIGGIALLLLSLYLLYSSFML